MISMHCFLLILMIGAEATELAFDRITPPAANLIVTIGAKLRTEESCYLELATNSLSAPGVRLVPTAQGPRLVGAESITYDVRYRPEHLETRGPGTPGYDILRHVLALLDVIWRSGQRAQSRLREDGTSVMTLKFLNDRGRVIRAQTLDPGRPYVLSQNERADLPHVFAEVRLIVEQQRFPRGYLPLGVRAAGLFATYLKRSEMGEDWFELPAYFANEERYYMNGGSAFDTVFAEAVCQSKSLAIQEQTRAYVADVRPVRAPRPTKLRPRLNPRRRPGGY